MEQCKMKKDKTKTAKIGTPCCFAVVEDYEYYT